MYWHNGNCGRVTILRCWDIRKWTRCSFQQPVPGAWLSVCSPSLSKIPVPPSPQIYLHSTKRIYIQQCVKGQLGETREGVISAGPREGQGSRNRKEDATGNLAIATLYPFRLPSLVSHSSNHRAINLGHLNLKSTFNSKIVKHAMKPQFHSMFITFHIY